MTEKKAFFDYRNITSTVFLNLILGVLAVFVTFRLTPDLAIRRGVIFGLILGILNYIALITLMKRLLKTGSKKGVMSFLLFLKMLFLFGLIAISVSVFEVHIVALLVGYLCMIVVGFFQCVAGLIQGRGL